MSTHTTDPSTAWLGEYAADLTPEQVDSLNHLRAELTGPGVSTASTIRVLLEDAADYAEHTRTQRAAAHVPHPTGAVGVVEDWQEWDDGTIRRSYDTASWENTRPTLDTVQSTAISVWAGACEILDAPSVRFVGIAVDFANLTPAEARRVAQQLTEAADKVEAVQGN